MNFNAVVVSTTGALEGLAWEKCCVGNDLFSAAIRICLYGSSLSRHYLPIQDCLQNIILDRYLHTEPPYHDAFW